MLPLWCLGATVANQSIFRLGAMSPAWAILLVLAIAALYWAAPDFQRSPVEGGQQPPRAANILLGIVALGPLLFDLAAGWNREFPFSGDSYFHVGQSYRLALWWLSPVASPIVRVPTIDDIHRLTSHPSALPMSRIIVLAVITTATALLYRRSRTAALCFVTVTAVIWGSTEATIFLRYPGARYLLDLPFLGAAFMLHDPELAGRISNVAAAACWIFVLRPWLVGRWPDFRVLPVAFLLLWQKEMIYYFDSVYLEPWGVVFSLLAVEVLFENGRNGAALACLLVGAAAAVKEPFIVALPFMWLAGAPWRGKPLEFIRLSAAAVAAGMPFLLYFAARRSIDVADLGVDRSLHLFISSPNLQHYFSEFAKQMTFSFPGTSSLLAIGVLLAIPVMLWLHHEQRLALACCLGSGLMIAALFVLDLSSQGWAGYFRFLMYSIPFFVAGVMVLARSLRPSYALTLTALILLLQAPSAYTALARAAGLPTDRNFVEHYDAPLVFPIKSLIAEAERERVLSPAAPIAGSLVDATLRNLPPANIVYGPVGKLYCSCDEEHPNVLALFIRFAHMSAFLATDQFPADSRFGQWQRIDAQRQACLIELRQSCRHVFRRMEGGELVGALGTKK